MGARVVLYELLSGNNDYGVELVRALGAVVPLTVVTVDNTRLNPSDCDQLLSVVPAFAKPQARWRKAWLMARAYAVLVRECLRAPRATVLHVEFLRFERLERWLFGLLQLVGVKLVTSAHNALPHMELPWHRQFYKRWYEQVDAVHVLSRSVQASITSDVGAQPKQWALIGHGPYLGLRQRFGQLDPVQARQRLGIAADRFVILQYGLFKPYKGVDRLAEAVSLLPSDVRPLLVLAGAGPVDYLAAVRADLLKAGREDCLMWLERYVDDEELCALITLADLVVFPYTKVSQSGALFLAMTFGKPCLCSDLPGFRELLPNEPSIYFDIDDVQALSARLGALTRDPQGLKPLHQAVLAASLRGFNWDDIAQASKQLYRQLLVGGNQAVHP